MNTTTMSTPFGPFTILASDDEAVLAAGFTVDPKALLALVHPDLKGEARPRADLGRITAVVASYLDGDLTALDEVPVRQHSAGAFLPLAWDEMRHVKPGDPITYTELAARSGRPAAVRAAAQACARNAAALFVPCHRVIRADRSMGGYRWGVGVKRSLLAHENDRKTV
jgi:methylated-DNA-[protein]-cysteine S-methyltransferase